MLDGVWIAKQEALNGRCSRSRTSQARFSLARAIQATDSREDQPISQLLGLQRGDVRVSEHALALTRSAQAAQLTLSTRVEEYFRARQATCTGGRARRERSNTSAPEKSIAASRGERPPDRLRSCFCHTLLPAPAVTRARAPSQRSIRLHHHTGASLAFVGGCGRR